MAVFKMTTKVTVSACTEVEADSVNEAFAIAARRSVELGGLGGEDMRYAWVIDEADGEPQDITIDED